MDYTLVRLREHLRFVATTKGLVSVFLQYRYQQLVPELAFRLVSSPLSIEVFPDYTCNVVLYDNMERTPLKEGIDLAAAESLKQQVAAFWTRYRTRYCTSTL